MAKGDISILAAFPGQKKLDMTQDDVEDLVAAMESSRKPGVGNAAEEVLVLFYCVAKVSCASPHEFSTGWCIGTDHDYRRGQEAALAKIHCASMAEVQDAYGKAFVEAACDKSQGIIFEKIHTYASSLNGGHLSDRTRKESENLWDNVLLNVIENKDNAKIYPVGSKLQKTEKADAAPAASGKVCPTPTFLIDSSKCADCVFPYLPLK
jgi:hypothetical protein